MEFKDWLTRKYIEWRGDAVGNERSISEFSRLLGIDKSLVSQWMSGNKRPGLRKLGALASMYPEVYDVLGLTRPDDKVEYLLDFIRKLPANERRPFAQAAYEADQRILAGGYDPDSPEAMAIWEECLKKNGLKVK